MTSRLSNLSPVDFEELCRDIARIEMGIPFSAFGPGPDGGIDGRHSNGGNSTILQCKHYIGSGFSALMSTMKKESEKLQKLNPDRYILFTSQSLTPSRVDKLSRLLEEYLNDVNDIWGKENIEGSLRRNPEIEKSHIKLWLGSTAVLEKILQSGLEAYIQTTKKEIINELKVYVQNESYDEAIKKLEEQNILVISGPPGVGKTTLAKILSYYYLNEGWQFCAIKNLDEGFIRINDQTPTIFYFDDFLGRIKLDRQSLLQSESAFGAFVRRIRDSKNARFVLTTRAHIFEEARQISDYVDDRHLQLSKYLLDVGSYTRKVKSHILYNHLSVSNLTKAHFEFLLEGDWLKKIIDHRNYNPRVIAFASSDNIESIEPEKYPSYLFKALESPELIWRKPLSALDMKSLNLLVALYFGSEYGQSIKKLKINFNDLHRNVSAHHSQPTMPTDFDDTLKSLESGFVSISEQSVSFINPSLRDYLKSYLVERELLLLLPTTVRRADWGRNLWSHIKDAFKTRPDNLREFALKFRKFSEQIDENPTLVRSKYKHRWVYLPDDLPLSNRVELLLEWWEASTNEVFIDKAFDLLKNSNNKLKLIPWRDGQSLPEIYWRVQNILDVSHPLKQNLLEAISTQLAALIDSGVSIDDLINIIKSVQDHMGDETPESVEEMISYAIDYELSETDDAINHLDSEQSLIEHLEYLDALAALTGESVEVAKEIVSQRLGEFEEPDYGEHQLIFPAGRESVGEEFSDEAIRSLFGNLLR